MIDLAEKLDEETAKRIRISTHYVNRASEAAYVDQCIRYLVISRTDTQAQELHDVSLQRIFDEGNAHHVLLKREIEDAGFEFKDQERDFPPNDYELSGHIDGQVKMEISNCCSAEIGDGHKLLPSHYSTSPSDPLPVCMKCHQPCEIESALVPIEMKSCSPNVFRTVSTYKTAKELLECRHIWVQRYPAQIMVYLYLLEKEFGIILFKDKSTGRKHQIDVPIDYKYVQHILDTLVKVNEMVRAKKPPPPKSCDACKMCSFAKTFCFTSQDFGTGFSLMDDTQIIEKLKRHHKLYPLHKEWDDLDTELKAGFKGRPTIIGDFKITSNSHMRGDKEVFRTEINKL